jgi:hypothetical protein
VTSLRFDWQQKIVAAAKGKVLNVGANEDPAGLKATFPDKVINCDLVAYDVPMQRWNLVDVVFDCTESPWPFEDDSVEIALFGDIIEHLSVEQQRAAFTEARRVAKKLAITVPEDDRFLTAPDPWDHIRGATHITTVTEELLRSQLATTGWKVVEWETVDYFFVSRGFFVLAERA